MWINRGHLVANIDPLALTPRPTPQVLELGYFGLTPQDLDSEFITGSRTDTVPRRMKLRDDPGAAEDTSGGGNIGAEFAHVSESDERLWLQDEFQQGRLTGTLTTDERRNILWQLTAAEGLERYLHTKYVGQEALLARGSGDAFIPLLDDLIQNAGAGRRGRGRNRAWPTAAD